MSATTIRSHSPFNDPEGADPHPPPTYFRNRHRSCVIEEAAMLNIEEASMLNYVSVWPFKARTCRYVARRNMDFWSQAIFPLSGAGQGYRKYRKYVRCAPLFRLRRTNHNTFAQRCTPMHISFLNRVTDSYRQQLHTTQTRQLSRCV